MAECGTCDDSGYYWVRCGYLGECEELEECPECHPESDDDRCKRHPSFSLSEQISCVKVLHASCPSIWESGKAEGIQPSALLFLVRSWLPFDLHPGVSPPDHVHAREGGEVSRRQTGRTTEALGRAVEVARRGERAVFFVHKQSMVPYCAQLLEKHHMKKGDVIRAQYTLVTAEGGTVELRSAGSPEDELRILRGRDVEAFHDHYWPPWV